MKYEKKVTHPKFLALILKGKRLQDSGFTLVELIVVITILAILSTIGFVSYSGYLSGVRDTNRISQLKSIVDGLDLYSIKKTLPLPDNYIEIKSGVDIIVCSGAGAGITISACNTGANTLYTNQIFPDNDISGDSFTDPRTLSVNEWAGGLYQWGNSSLDLADKIGPCETGYHIPSQAEWSLLVSTGDGTGKLWDIAGTSTEGDE